MIPFTVEDFFGLFATYNAAIWPMQWLLTGMALVAVVAVLARARHATVIAGAVLGFLWLWMGLVYHVMYFRTINPAATAFGAAFLVQAGLFAHAGLQSRIGFGARADLDGVAGAALLIYALVAYPLLGYVLGHRYPATPTFGAPCPTTIFTLGLLLWTRGRVPFRLVIVPGLWAVIGLSAAIALRVPQDVGLFVAAAVAVPLLLRRRRHLPATASWA